MPGYQKKSTESHLYIIIIFVMFTRKNNQKTLKIICSEDCGNSPRKAQLKDLNIAFARNDVDSIMEHMSDGIVWRMVGDRVVRGKEELEKTLLHMADIGSAAELRIDHIITHGKEGALDGCISFDNGQQVAFCDIYVFSSHSKKARIKELTSYAVQLHPEKN